MILTSVRVKVKKALDTYQAGGMIVLLYHAIGYFWKECAWLWIRMRTHSELIERTIYGNRMYLSSHDTGISKELAVFGTHEPIATRLLNQQIKPGMHVVDIGANIGYYALQEARLVGETGEVIAIEPVPDNVSLLTKNIEANGYQNLRIYSVAIGAENGTTKLYLSHESNLAALTSQKDVHDTCIDVPLRTLDSFLEYEGQVDLIRMDIEGYETEAIKGMIDILAKHKPILFIEIHQFIVGGEPIIQFLRTLKELGYETRYVIGRVFDNAVVKGKKYTETMSLDELMLDRWVVQGRGAMTIFCTTM